VKKLEEKPFALIGVNVNESDAKKLKATMEKNKLNWRSFADKGVITEKWNSPGTPSYYVLDYKGVIRYKWVGSPGEKAMDAALDKLIQEAQTDHKKPPK
jgi:peroxiredoxin